MVRKNSDKGSWCPIQYPILNDINYGLFFVKMGIILCSLGVWIAIEGDVLINEEKDQGALASISQAIPDEVMLAIDDKQTAKVAWEKRRTCDRRGDFRVTKFSCRQYVLSVDINWDTNRTNNMRVRL